MNEKLIKQLTVGSDLFEDTLLRWNATEKEVIDYLKTKKIKLVFKYNHPAVGKVWTLVQE